MRSAKLWFAIAAITTIILAGCGIFRSSSVYLTLQADPQANFGAPIPVDFVFVSKPELEQQILALSAQEWFARRAQLQRDYPDEDVLQIVSFEFTPGQHFEERKVKGNGASMAIVFVGFGRSSAVNRARVPVGSHVVLRLGEQSYAMDVEP